MKRKHVVSSSLITALLAACGSDNSSPDANEGPITGEHYKYVVDTLTIPVNTAQIVSLGLDLDAGTPMGDLGVDNQLGNALATLASMGFDNQGAITNSLRSGSIILLADLQTTSFSAASNAGLSLGLGENPMPAPCTNPADPLTCGQHLLGTGSFTVANTPGTLSGPIVAGKFTGGPGSVQVQIALQEGSPITLNLIGARAELSGMTADGVMTGKIGGAVAKSEVDNTIIPTVATQLDETIGEDCTRVSTMGTNDCGCMVDTSGADLVSGFDDNHDCSITGPELAMNNIVTTLLLADVTINGTPAVSLGVGITGKKASF